MDKQSSKRKNYSLKDKTSKRQKIECNYGINCFRKNPHHFKEYSHPHLEKILDNYKGGGDFEIPEKLNFQKEVLEQQLRLLLDNNIYSLNMSEVKVEVEGESASTSQVLETVTEEKPKRPDTLHTASVNKGAAQDGAEKKKIEDFFGVVAPKGGMAEKHAQAAPYYLFYTTITSAPATHSQPLSITFQGQSGFYFSQPDTRFVTNNAQNVGQLFPNNFGNQYRSTAQALQDFSQQQVFSNQGKQQNFQQDYNRNNRQSFQSARSQPSGNYFITQTDFQSRPNQYPSRGLSPTSFQVNHPASTNRPEFSHFSQQSSHNHDPSKPEVFLGQITINNPDPFPNNPEDDQHFNSPRIRPPGVVRSPSLDFDANFPSAAEPVNQDIFEYTDNLRATTYNPRNKASNRIVHNPPRPNFISSNKDDVDSLQNKPISTAHENFFSSGESFSSDHNRFKPRIPITTTTVAPPNKVNKLGKPIVPKPGNKLPVNSFQSNKPGAVINRPIIQSSTTEYKPLFDLAPLLEDEIPERNYGNKKATNGSEDVEVIKSSDKPATYDDEDLKTSDVEKTTKVTVGKQKNTEQSKSKNVSMDNEHSENIPNITITTYSTEEYQTEDDLSINNHNGEHLNADDTEYYDEIIEYIDEVPQNDKTKPLKDEEYDEIIEYEEIEEKPHDKHEDHTTIKDSTFEILTMKPKQMVKDDNFKEFVDSSLIDNTEPPLHVSEEYVEAVTEVQATDPPSILGEEVVSVVTTKSVVNGTYSVPNNSNSASTLQMNGNIESTTVATDIMGGSSNSTESWVVVASVQTSRSVSGARFLPFPGVAQEEKKQTLAELEDEDNDKNTENKTDIDETEVVTIADLIETNTKSTESIIDKLDRVQSELSSGLLAGGFKGDNKDIDVITEMTFDNFTNSETTTLPPPLQIFTVKSTSTVSPTERSTPEPPAVMIKKFSPHSRPSTTTTTAKPKPKSPAYEIIVDDLAGLLPPGFKLRPSFKDRKITTTTTTTEPASTNAEEKPELENQGRSSGISFKNKIATKDDVSAFLPKGYKPSKEEKPTTVDDVIKSIKAIDVSHLLPPGYKPENKSEAPVKTNSTRTTNVTAFLPKGYKQLTTTTEGPKTTQKSTDKLSKSVQPVDITAFLPPGFKFPRNESSKDGSKPPQPEVIKVADISSFLPPGFKLDKDEDKSKNPIQQDISTKTPSTVSSGGSGPFKVVFPSRPGAGKPGKRLTTPRTDVAGSGMGSSGVSVPSIQKGWPTRATTEFTGWPTQSTTPFSVKDLLETLRAATAKSPADDSSLDIASTERFTTTSTTPSTTTTTVQPTTPGVCTTNCDLAATIKIVEGVKWVPELLNHNTKEWQLLANEVSRELDAVYSKSPALKKWYKGVRIDAFSEGSVLVDYFVELNDVTSKVDTSQLKKLFHKSLTEAKPGSVLVDDDSLQDNRPDKLTGRKIDGGSVLDEEQMLGDQPPEEREIRKKDISKGKLEIGKFIVDPMFTEFIVLPKRSVPTIGFAEENNLLPQWGIAVIVIALASLLFVVIFGVTVIVNRQKNAKAKQPIPLSDDMLRELDKSHMGGDLYLQEHEPPYHKVRNQKRNSPNMLEHFEPYPGNPGDSWRSEWGPYYSQFSQSLQHQHYAPDSGRGSGNYTYNDSQIYGYNGSGSQKYGYSGEGVRTMYPRRRSDLDSNL